MEQGPVILEVKCTERDGEIVRSVRFAPLTVEKLGEYWERLKGFKTLFNIHIKDFADFLGVFIKDNNGVLDANGLIWEVDDVGILWITDIYPNYQASAHFCFWDRRYAGRERLLQEMIGYVANEYGFHRIVSEVPFYSRPTMALVKRLGFTREGTYRQAVMYQGKWFDSHFYSILREEINNILGRTNDGIPEAGHRNETAEESGDSPS